MKERKKKQIKNLFFCMWLIKYKLIFKICLQFFFIFFNSYRFKLKNVWNIEKEIIFYKKY